MADLEEEQSFAQELSDEFDALIQRKLAERGGGIAEGFIFWVNYMDKDGESNFAFGSPEGQRISTTTGIIGCASAENRIQLERFLRDDD